MQEDLTFNDLPNAVAEMNQKLSKLEGLIETFCNSSYTEKKEEDKPINIQEAAKFLNLSVPTIYSKVSRNEIPYAKQGKRLYFFKKDLLAYLKKGKSKSTSDIHHEAESYLSNLKRK